MRTNGEKGVRERARDKDGLHKRRGIWHYKLKIEGRWREFSTRTSSYQEARRIRRKAIEEQEEGRLPTEIGKWKFERAATEWLSQRARHVAPQTLRIDRERLVPLIRVFAGSRLDEIASDRGSPIRAYQLARTRAVGNRTINLETKVLRMILRSAKLWSRVADDYKPLPENKRGPGRALSPEGEKRLFDVASSVPGWAVAYYAGLVAANTTARGCEIKGLRLSDVDLAARTITIRRSTTKTDAGCRIVPLNTTAAWALTRLLERASLLGSNEPSHYVFPAFRFRHTKEVGQGTGYDPTRPMRSWRSGWRALTRKAGFPGLRFHDMRHHCITKLAEAGVPEQTLMAIAGHVSREMLEHYSHIRMQAKRDAVAALEAPRDPTVGETNTTRPVN